jgi:hypothetical protein
MGGIGGPIRSQDQTKLSTLAARVRRINHGPVNFRSMRIVRFINSTVSLITERGWCPSRQAGNRDGDMAIGGNESPH